MDSREAHGPVEGRKIVDSQIVEESQVVYQGMRFSRRGSYLLNPMPGHTVSQRIASHFEEAAGFQGFACCPLQCF